MGGEGVYRARAPGEDISLYAVEPVKHDRASEELLQLLSWARDARAIQGKAESLRLCLSFHIQGVPETLPGVCCIGELREHGDVGLLCGGREAGDVPQEGGVHGGLLADRQPHVE